MKDHNTRENKSHFRFDDWDEVVDCNDCKHYYDETCDGALRGTQKPCKTFLAIRRVDIPLQIKSLQRAVKLLVAVSAGTVTFCILHWIFHVLGWV